MARPTTALIVDDEAHVRVFMRLLLKDLGITECWEAADGITAVQLVQHQKPGLVLLDVNLPGLNGLEVLAQLRQVDEDLPVVIVTSQSSMGVVNESVRLGASGYVLKHSPREVSFQALQEILESLDDEPEQK